MKLLVVDDQQSVHLFVEKVLDLTALNISALLHAQNGAEALDIIKTQQPELMLLDIQMPILSGVELLRNCNNQGVTLPYTIILSAYSEFEYAQQSIRLGVASYILKPIDIAELNSEVERGISNLLQQQATAASKLLQQTLLYRHGLTKESIEFSMLGNAGFYCAAIKVDEKSPTSVSTLLSKAFASYSDSILGYHLLFCRSCDDYEKQVELLLSSAECLVGVSHFKEEPKQLSVAVWEAQTAVQQSFYDTKPHRYNPKDIFNEGPISVSEITAIQHRLSTGEVEKLRLTTEQLFERFEQLHLSPDYVKKLCYALLLYLGEDFAVLLERVDTDSFGDSAIFYSCEVIKELFLQSLLGIVNEMSTNQPSADLDIIQKVRLYIDRNLKEDLSLETVSNKFFISKFQLSRNFKKVFSINYQEYIINTKMEKAAQLLLTSEMRLYEICDQVGFDEPSYFSNVFKKHFGCSPRRFRLNNQGTPID